MVLTLKRFSVGLLHFRRYEKFYLNLSQASPCAFTVLCPSTPYYSTSAPNFGYLCMFLQTYYFNGVLVEEAKANLL